MKTNKTLNLNGTPTKVECNFKILDYNYTKSTALCSVTIFDRTYNFEMLIIGGEGNSNKKRGFIYEGQYFTKNEKLFYSFLLNNK